MCSLHPAVETPLTPSAGDLTWEWVKQMELQQTEVTSEGNLIAGSFGSLFSNMEMPL